MTEISTKLKVAEACGFARAVFQAFMSPEGTDGAQVMEAIDKLSEAMDLLEAA